MDGTRTFLVGDREVAVIDPGPDVPAHLDALEAALATAELERVLGAPLAPAADTSEPDSLD